MSFDIHIKIPEDSPHGHLIASLSARDHITHSEAAERVLRQAARAEAGIEEEPRIPGLPIEPLNDEDSAMMDEIVEGAMKARRERWARYSSG